MTVRPFDVRGPLPTGVTMLEASAGTGKTFTIAALAARYVAEGTPLDRLLLVTFTRMATGELRDRVRERLVAVEQGLARALAGAPPRDEVVALLAEGPPEVVRVRRDRLSRALADFDAATIATTHGFCQEVLSGLGVVGDVEPGTEFVEDLDDLLEEVVDDLYVRRFHQLGLPQFERREAMQIARAAVENPTAPVVPLDGAGGEHRRHAGAPGAARARRARGAQAAQRGDDLRRPADAAQGDARGRLGRGGGAAAAGALRRRAGRRVPGHRPGAVGHPAARVRRRRGDARADRRPEAGDLRVPRGRRVRVPGRCAGGGRARDARRQLAQRPGADRRLRRAVRQRAARARGDRVPARAGGGAEPRAGARARAGDGAAAAAAGVARGRRDDAARLRARARGRASTSPPTSRAASSICSPRRRRSGRSPAAASRSGRGTSPCSCAPTAPARSCATRSARRASRPSSAGRAACSARRRRATGSCSSRRSSVPRRRRTRGRRRSPASSAGAPSGWPRPARPSGRRSTGACTGGRTCCARGAWRRCSRRSPPPRACPAACSPRRAGSATSPTCATSASCCTRRRPRSRWAPLRSPPGCGGGSPPRARRRVTRSAAGAWSPTPRRSRCSPSTAARGSSSRSCAARTCGSRAGCPRAASRCSSTTRTPGTRGRSTSGSTAPTSRPTGACTATSSGGRTCGSRTSRSHARAIRRSCGGWRPGTAATRRSAGCSSRARRDGTVPAEGRGTPTDVEAETRLRELAAEAPGCVAAERSHAGPAADLAGPRPPGRRAHRGELRPHARPRLAPHLLQRHHGRRRRAARGQRAGGADAHRRTALRPRSRRRLHVVPADADAPAGSAGDPLRAVPSLLGGDAGRRARGDVRAPRARGDRLRGRRPRRRAGRAVAGELARRPVEVGDRAAVVAGLRAAIETPLGPLAGGARLRDLTRADRLDELDFELPLAGGDAPAGRLTPAAIAGVLRAHAPAGDPVAAYADRLADPALRQEVRGYLTGSIDLVVRLPRATLRARRLQDQLARRRRRRADRLAPPPGGARPRRCGAPTTGSRRCSTRSPSTGTCAGDFPATRRSATWRACSTCSCAG